jgi:hypothetical protein
VARTNDNDNRPENNSSSDLGRSEGTSGIRGDVDGWIAAGAPYGVRRWHLGWAADIAKGLDPSWAGVMPF